MKTKTWRIAGLAIAAHVAVVAALYGIEQHRKLHRSAVENDRRLATMVRDVAAGLELVAIEARTARRAAAAGAAIAVECAPALVAEVVPAAPAEAREPRG